MRPPTRCSAIRRAIIVEPARGPGEEGRAGRRVGSSWARARTRSCSWSAGPMPGRATRCSTTNTASSSMPRRRRRAGATPVKAPEVDLTANVDNLLAAVTPETRIVFVANPSNPTGTYLPVSEIERLHADLPENVLLVIDAAYAEFCRREDYEIGTDLVDRCENVIVTRTFSKLYGLAGLRLGWGYGSARGDRRAEPDPRAVQCRLARAGGGAWRRSRIRISSSGRWSIMRSGCPGSPSRSPPWGSRSRRARPISS